MVFQERETEEGDSQSHRSQIDGGGSEKCFRLRPHIWIAGRLTSD